MPVSRPPFPLLLLCGLMTSCLEAPQAPKTAPVDPGIAVRVRQGDSTLEGLRLQPGDSLQLYAEVTPAQTAQQLSFEWFLDNDQVATGQLTPMLYSSPYEAQSVAMELRVSDQEGNERSYAFALLLDHPPRIEKTIEPGLGDSLPIGDGESLHFSWASSDADPGDTLLHFLDLGDGKHNLLRSFPAGSALEADVAGFLAGTQSYRLRVYDQLGLSDTSDWIDFNLVSRVLP